MSFQTCNLEFNRRRIPMRMEPTPPLNHNHLLLDLNEKKLILSIRMSRAIDFWILLALQNTCTCTLDTNPKIKASLKRHLRFFAIFPFLKNGPRTIFSFSNNFFLFEQFFFPFRANLFSFSNNFFPFRTIFFPFRTIFSFSNNFFLFEQFFFLFEQFFPFRANLFSFSKMFMQIERTSVEPR